MQDSKNMNNQPEIAGYKNLELLGSGAFGKVYKAVRDSDGQIIALKVINIPDDKPYLVQQTDQEVEFLKTLSGNGSGCNPYVICYYGSHYDPSTKQYFIEMELIEGGDMGKYITHLRNTQSPEVLYYYLLLIAQKIAEGLKYSHNKGITHNDIKLENIMIDTNGVPRLIDYGLACTTGRFSEGNFCVSTSGSPAYVAPEYFYEDNKRYPVSDLWALGISLYEGATGSYPYTLAEQDIPTLFEAIKTQEPARLNTSNQQLNDLVNGLLVRDHTKRLTSEQVLTMLDDIPIPGEEVINGEVEDVGYNGTEEVIGEVGEVINGTEAMDISSADMAGEDVPEYRTTAMSISSGDMVGSVEEDLPESYYGGLDEQMSLNDPAPITDSREELMRLLMASSGLV